MTTYIYETIPTEPDDQVRYFEIRQSMTEPALTRHPESGVPIRRVIIGGYGILKTGDAPETPSSCGCGPGGCCD